MSVCKDDKQYPIPCREGYDEHLKDFEQSEDCCVPQEMQRQRAVYKSYDERYRVKDRNYERQYSQVYFYRLVKLRPIVIEAAEQKWPGVPYVRVLDVSEEREVFTVGTLYKEMALKPSILDEYTKERSLGQQLGNARFAQASDGAVLEDENARVTLARSAAGDDDGLDVGNMATGTVVAVRGKVAPSGEFVVVDTCFAGIPSQQIPLPSQSKASSGKTNGQDVGGNGNQEEEEEKYVALMSGFSLGDEGASHHLQMEMMLDYCSGILGAEPEQRLASRIVRVVVAGGILKGNASLSQPTAYASVREQAMALTPIRDADSMLSELAQNVNVDIMPGVADPANYSLPQQPLHPCLFPRAATLSTFTRCTNPHAFSLDGVSFLGTSGQNVDDIRRYTNMEECTDILEKMLEWRHCIPTAPDSLAAYPYCDADPFILDEAPHVLFAGGQPKFSTSLVKGPQGQTIRTVAIPEFSALPVMVLISLKTLEATPVEFDAVINT